MLMCRLRGSRLLFFICFFIFHFIGAEAQQKAFSDYEYYSKLNFGVGEGLDYGGFGFRLGFVPENHLILFVGGGYNLVGPTYNFGTSIKFNLKNRFRFYYTLMYGYNGVIKVQNASEYDKTYYGVSTGAGVELHLKRKRNNFLNFELLFPFQSKKYDEDFEGLKRNPNIKSYPETLPFTFSVGYHFSLD